MALAPCTGTVDRFGQELVEHGSAVFPIACYYNDMTQGDVPWHWHQELEMCIVAQGTAVVTVGQHQYTVPAGQGLFINSGVLHDAYGLEGTACRLHAFVFHPRLVGGASDSIFYQKYLRPLIEDSTLECCCLHPDVPWQKEILTAIESIWQICVQEQPGYEFRVRNGLSEIIWTLSTHCTALPRVSRSKSLRDSERIKLMLSFIHEHYGSEITTGQIAASAAISESECLRCFRSAIGSTPIRYLKHYRVRQAASQLLSSDDRISEIAVRCGFQDISYFSKSFREEKGCTPSQFRTSSKSQP